MSRAAGGGNRDVLARQRAARAANDLLARELFARDGVLDLMCECGRVRCPSWLAVAAQIYDRVSPGQWLVVRSHADLAVDKVVELLPGDVAITEPRSIPGRSTVRGASP